MIWKRLGDCEDTRYRVYRLGAHIAWWGAFAWTSVLTYVNLAHTAMATSSICVSGLFIVLLMGVAIALGSALSRMRLAGTIADVFEVGMRLADERQAGLKEWALRQVPHPADSDGHKVNDEAKNA